MNEKVNERLFFLAIPLLHKEACGILIGLRRDLKIHTHKNVPRMKLFISVMFVSSINFGVVFNTVVAQSN